MVHGQDFRFVKIQSIAPIDGRRWPVGHTALVSEEYGTELIDAGLAHHKKHVG